MDKKYNCPYFSTKCDGRNQFCSIHIVTCGFDTWAEGQHSHLQHNMAKWNLYSCKTILPKNVLASLALQISCCSAALYIVKLGLKCRKLHWHTSQQSPKWSDAVCVPQSLDSDQSDGAICASVKVSDYYTVDSSSWICVWLTTVGSNPDSLNQNKHLGSIISCWKPLIVNSQSTLSRSLNSGLMHSFYTDIQFISGTPCLWFISLVCLIFLQIVLTAKSSWATPHAKVVLISYVISTSKDCVFFTAIDR